MRIVYLFSVVLFLFLPSTAWAACTGPAAIEGDFIYNKDYKTIQFCNGTNWIRMDPAINESDPEVGDVGTLNNLCRADGTKVVCDIFTGGDREIFFSSGGIFTSSSGLVFTSAGRLSLPSSLLVSGDTATCDNTLAGAMRYDSAGSKLDLCDGTNWLAVNTGSGGKWLDGVENGEIYYSSNVGIGTNDPVVLLDVEGEIRLDSTLIACSATIGGAIRYRSGSGVEYCDGSVWKLIAATGTGVNLVISPLFDTTMDVDGTCGTATCTGTAVTFTVTNQGDTTSSALSYSLVGDTANFTVVADTCTAATLGQNQTCQIDVEPTANGNLNYSATLTIPQHNNPGAFLEGTATGFGCLTGLSAFGGVVVACDYAGVGNHLIAMPSGCDGTTVNPICSGTDTVDKFWASNLVNTYSISRSPTEGAQNTVNLIAYGMSPGTLPAAEYCDVMDVNSQTDWYLPSPAEMELAVDTQILGTPLGLAVTNYWTSRETNAGDAYGITSAGNQASQGGGGTKTTNARVRCMRVEGVALPAAQADDVPDNSLTFATKFATAAALSTQSNTVTVTGITPGIAISIAGDASAQFSINGGGFIAGPSTVNWGDTVQLQADSPAAGTRLDLTLTIGSSADGWSIITVGDCGGSCAGVDKRVFVTSTTYNGSGVGSVGGADAHCQTQANAAGLGGTWESIISGTTISANERINYNWDRLVNLNGDVIATDVFDLWDGSITNPVRYDETGAIAAVNRVLTGTDQFGVTGGSACGNWTSNLGGIQSGDALAAGSTWMVGGPAGSCGAAGALYCMEQTTGAIQLAATPSTQANMNVVAPGNPALGTPVVFTIQNMGTSTSAVLSTSIPVNGTNFQITGDTCTGNTLAAAATCTVTVTPQAFADGTYNGTLKVEDVTNNVAVSIGMSGVSTGFGSAVAIWLKGTADDIYYNSGAAPMVGIGLTDPTTDLEVAGTTKTNVLRIAKTTGAAAPMSASTAAGGAGEVQYNSGGALAANGSFYWDSATTSLGIGTAVPNDGKIEVMGGTVCVDTNSDGLATSCITAESDIRLKKNVKTIEGALAKVQQLRGVEFDWRWDEFDFIGRYQGKPHAIGVIAQDVEKVFPEALGEDINGYMSVEYRLLIPPLIEAIKEQQVQIEKQQALNEKQQAALEGQQAAIEALRAEIEALKASQAAQ